MLKLKKACYICLNFIDFSTKKYCWQEIGASNSVAEFIDGEYSMIYITIFSFDGTFKGEKEKVIKINLLSWGLKPQGQEQ